MERKRVSQIQCPTCGEQRMTRMEHFGWGQIFLSFITLGMYAILSAVIASRTSDPALKPGDHVKCQNCGARWIFES